MLTDILWTLAIIANIPWVMGCIVMWLEDWLKPKD